jgi:hypothetical protein
VGREVLVRRSAPAEWLVAANKKKNQVGSILQSIVFAFRSGSSRSKSAAVSEGMHQTAVLVLGSWGYASPIIEQWNLSKTSIALFPYPN